MSAHIASAVFTFLIVGLFWLDRDREARTTKALWIPTVWLLINASRPVSQWLAVFGLAPATSGSLDDIYLEGSPTDRNVYVAILVLGLIVLIHRKRQVRPLLKKNGAILLYFSYCLLSLLWSDFPFLALKHWTKSIGDLVMILVVLTEPEVKVALKRILARAAFLLIPLSILFIKYYPLIGREYRTWVWTPMYSGVTLFKNLLGTTCLVCGLGSLWSFLSAYDDREGQARSRHLLAHGSIIVMTMWLLWISDSKTSLSCFFLAGGLMVIASRARQGRKPRLIHLLVAGAVLFPVITLFSSLGGGVIASMGRNESLTGRNEIWRTVISVSKNPWLGTGYETFWLGDRLHQVWTGVGETINEAHNGFLEVYLNLGWVGIGILALLLCTGYRNILLEFRRDTLMAALKVAYFVACVIYSLTEAGFRLLSPIWLLFLVAIMDIPALSHAAPRFGFDLDHSEGIREHASEVSNVLTVG